MPTELLTMGPISDMTQNVIYALPARAVRLRSAAAVEVSYTTGTTGFAVLANSTTGAETNAVFVRCTTGNTTIVVKPL